MKTRNTGARQRLRGRELAAGTALLLAALLLIGSPRVFGAYRNVSPGGPEAEPSEADAGQAVASPAAAPRPAPTRGWSRAVVTREDGKSELRNRRGSFQDLVLEPGEEIGVELEMPGLGAQGAVFAYTVHGGRIDGQVSARLRAGEDGKVRFRFMAGRYFGNYPVVVRCGGREELLNFWVPRRGEEATDAE